MLRRDGRRWWFDGRRAGVITVVTVLVAVVAAACVPASPAPVVADYRPSAAPGPYAELELDRGDGVPVALADPDVVRHEGRWFLYGTSSTEGFEAWSSADLTTWRYDGLVWRPRPGAWNDVASFWAPDVHRDEDGSFLMYYTAGQRIGVARGPSPLGPFTDLIDHPLVGGGFGAVGDGTYLRTGNVEADTLLNLDDQAIDAFVLDTTDGARYLYFSSSPTVGSTTITAHRLLDDAVLAPGPPTAVLSVEVLGWEGVIREAPWVEERNGRFHLTYSGSPFFNTCYAVGEAVADNPLGPFVRTGTGPFLHDDPAIGFLGPGHHALTTGPDGTDIIFFHTLRSSSARQARWAPVSHDQSGNLRLVDPPGRVGTGRSSCWQFPI